MSMYLWQILNSQVQDMENFELLHVSQVRVLKSVLSQQTLCRKSIAMATCLLGLNVCPSEFVGHELTCLSVKV